MGFSTFPNNPFPPSTAQFDEGKNNDIQAEIDAIKDGTNIDSFADVESALATKTNLSNIAPAFDATSGVYAVGDKVIYDGILYEFTSAHSTAGEWDESEVQPVKVSELVDSLKSGLTGLLKYKTFTGAATDTSNHLYDTGVSADQYACLGGVTPYNPNFSIQLSNLEITTNGHIRYKLYDVANNQVVSDNAAYTVYLVFVDKSRLSELVI